MIGKVNSAKNNASSGHLLVKWLALACGLGLLLACAAVVAIHSPRVQHRALDAIVAAFGRHSGLQISFEAFQWSPFSRLQMSRLEVATGAGQVLSCKEVALRYHLSLKWPYLAVEAISLGEPEFDLERDPEGNWHLPGMDRRGTSGPELGLGHLGSLPLPEVRVTNGRVKVRQGSETVVEVAQVGGELLSGMEPDTGRTLRNVAGRWEGRIEMPSWGPCLLEGRAHLQADRLTLVQAALEIIDKGRIEASGQWDLLAPFDGELRLDLNRLQWGALAPLNQLFSPLETLSGAVVTRRRTGDWTADYTFDSNLAKVSGKASWLSREGGPEVRLSTRIERFTPPLPQGTAIEIDGMVDLVLEGTDLQRSRARLVGRLGALLGNGERIEAGTLSASYRDGVMGVEASEILTPYGQVSLDGQADLAGMWDEKHAGGLKLSVRIEGGRLRELVPSWDEVAKGSVRVEALHGPGKFRRWAEWDCSGSGSIELVHSGTLKASGGVQGGVVDLGYELDVRDLTRISQLAPGLPGTGAARSRGRISGRWPRLVWTGDAQARRIKIADLGVEQADLEGQAELLGSKAPRRIKLEVKDLAVGPERIGSVTANLLQQEAACEFTVSAGRINGSGGARLEGRVVDLWATPRVLHIDKGQLTWNKLDATIAGRLELDADSAGFRPLTLSQGHQRIEVSGSIHRRASSDLDLLVENVDVAQWLALFGVRQLAAGSASGRAQVSGPSASPTLSLDFTLADARLEDRRELPTLMVSGRYADNRLEVQGRAQSPLLANKPLSFSGIIPLRVTLIPLHLALLEQAPLQGSATVSALKTEELQPFMPFLDQLAGDLDGQVSVGGTPAAPVVQGAGSWRRGKLQVSAWPHPIDAIEAEWRADAREITVTRSTMKLFGGSVSVVGRVDYPRFRVMEWQATGEHVTPPPFYGIKGQVAGKLTMKQAEDGAQLLGEFSLSDAKMNLGELERELRRNIKIIESDEKDDVIEMQESSLDERRFADRLQMDLRFRLPATGTKVTGKGIDAEVTGALTVKKAAGDTTRLHGQVSALRGTYRFQTIELKITEGELLFMGLPDPDPNLRILCVKEFRDATVQVQVTGPASRPKLMLSSVPSMGQVDILSYLVFGQPAGRLNSRESMQLQDRAASLVGSEASKVLKEALGKTPFSPDVLQYRGATEGTGGVVEIGKRITPDVYVTYEKGIAGQEKDELQIEYRVNRHISLETQLGRGGQSGADVYFRYDFGK